MFGVPFVFLLSYTGDEKLDEKTPKRIRNNWTPEEDELVIKVARDYRNASERELLSAMMEKLGGTRTLTQCKNHFRNLRQAGKIEWHAGLKAESPIKQDGTSTHTTQPFHHSSVPKKRQNDTCQTLSSPNSHSSLPFILCSLIKRTQQQAQRTPIFTKSSMTSSMTMKIRISSKIHWKKEEGKFLYRNQTELLIFVHFTRETTDEDGRSYLHHQSPCK